MTNYFPKTTETFIINKFIRLIKKGWDMHVFCYKENLKDEIYLPELKDQKIKKNIHVGFPQKWYILKIILSPFLFLKVFIKNPRGFLRYLCGGLRIFGIGLLKHLYFDSEIIMLKPDIIHFEFGALAYKRMYLKDLLNVRIIVSFRGYDINYIGLEDESYYREVWEKADILHFLGEDLWSKALRRGCPEDKPHVFIPPAVDTAFFNSFNERYEGILGSAQRPLRILSVGSLRWVKGYEYALSAISILKDKGIRCEYRIIGDGPYWEAVIFARKQLGLEDIVELLGELNQKEVKNQLAWADIFLHSAVSEGFCNVVLEAQAMGVPVVCSDAGGLPENVSDGETGFVVDRRNPKLLADKIEILAKNPALRKEMSEAARERVLTKFSLAVQIDAFEEMYKKIMA